MKLIQFLKISATMLSLLGLLYISGQSQINNQPSTTGSSVKQADYQISGRVVDQNNVPVPGVTVYCIENDRPVRSRPYTDITNSNGEFLFHGVTAGKNDILVEKEEAGYANTGFSIASTSVPVTVSVDEAHPEAETEIKLGQKSSRISGQVLEAASSQPVIDASINICLVDRPKLCSLTSVDEQGSFSLLTPLAPFTVKVISPTHKELSLSAAKELGTAGENFLLKSGEEKKLTIALEIK